MQKGFTLIEVIIYIALFSLIMGSALVTVYQLIDGSGKLSAKSVVQEEGSFVTRKINWALSSVNPAIAITPSSGTSASLTVTKYDGNKIGVKLNGTKIEMRESANGNIFLPITTDNVSVSSLSFEYIPNFGSGPFGIQATAILTESGDNFSFTITKYIRK